LVVILGGAIGGVIGGAIKSIKVDWLYLKHLPVNTFYWQMFDY